MHLFVCDVIDKNQEISEHVASVCGTLRRGQKTLNTKECVVIFQCPCTAQGPQQETGRNAALICCATVYPE